MQLQLHRAIADFTAFCDSLSRRLRPYQLEPARPIIDSVVRRRGHTIAILMARQAGKNELVACLSLWLALRLPGIKIGIYAPTFPQAVDITMRRIKRHLKRLASLIPSPRHPVTPSPRHPPPSPVSGLPSLLTDRRDLIEFTPPPADRAGPFASRAEGSLIGAHSAEKDAEKEGFTWDLILYDEAQDIDREVIDEEISPMGAATHATEVFIGTPYSIDCKFYDVIRALDERRLPGRAFSYPYQAIIPHVPTYARFIKKKALELGRDSVAFRTQYALEWVEGLGMFFSYEAFTALALPDEEFLSTSPAYAATPFHAAHSPAPPLSHSPLHPLSHTPTLPLTTHHSPLTTHYAVGIDLAGDDPGRTGRTDETAIAVLRCDPEARTLVDLHSWRGKDWERQFEEIARILRSLPGRVRAAVDATGMGDPFSDRLAKALAGAITVERVKLTAAAKSDIGLYAEQEVVGGRVSYAAGPRTRASRRLAEFLHQIRWLAREHLPNKAIRWYVSRDKGRDDLVCAFFLALWASRRRASTPAYLSTTLVAVDCATFDTASSHSPHPSYPPYLPPTSGTGGPRAPP